MTHVRSIPACWAACLTVLGGCAIVAPNAETQQIAVEFSLLANGRSARCGADLGPLGDVQAAFLHDARFYVHDLALLDANGQRVPVRLAINDWQDGQVALLDFEDGTSNCAKGSPVVNHVITGTVPARYYTGLEFVVGVPSALNHGSTEQAVPPLDVAAMAWSWRVGRKYAKIEIDPEGGLIRGDGSRTATWYIHLGATGCTGNPATGEFVTCQYPNLVPVRFDAFDAHTQQVALDLSILFQGSVLSRDEGGAVGCMGARSDPECFPIFDRLGLSIQQGMPVRLGHSPAFTIRNKP
jgi:uncharacterized repeat protein (TIGR04052 family)